MSFALNPLTPEFFYVRQFFLKSLILRDALIVYRLIGEALGGIFPDDLFLKGNLNFGKRGPYGRPG